MCDESLALALAAVLLIFIVFYTLYSIPKNQACFNSSPTDKYPQIDNFKGNWSGLDDNDKTAVMNISKTKLMLMQPPPLSMTSSRKLVDQDYGKTY
jgi:hypothetical protein